MSKALVWIILIILIAIGLAFVLLRSDSSEDSSQEETQDTQPSSTTDTAEENTLETIDDVFEEIDETLELLG